MYFISDIFTYDFLRNAYLAALMAGIVCGLVGSYIVSRRIVFISGGITHASFGGIGIGYFLGLNPVFGAAAFGVLSALGIEFISKNGKIREDSAIAILWSLGMALGIIFIYLTPGYAPNLMTYLFGNILMVSALDLYLLLGVMILVILVFGFLYRPILFIAFDEEFAVSRKIPVSLINYLMMALIALTIVFNIRVMGIILVISLLTIPQTIASLFSKQFMSLIMYSVLFSLIGSFAGIYFSFLFDIPSGASIIFTLVILYFLVRGGRRLAAYLRI